MNSSQLEVRVHSYYVVRSPVLKGLPTVPQCLWTTSLQLEAVPVFVIEQVRLESMAVDRRRSLPHRHRAWHRRQPRRLHGGQVHGDWHTHPAFNEPVEGILPREV